MKVGAKTHLAMDDRIAASAARSFLKLTRYGGYARLDAMLLLAYMILTIQAPFLDWVVVSRMP